MLLSMHGHACMWTLNLIVYTCVFFFFIHPQSNMKIRCKKNQALIQSQRSQLEAAKKRLAAERNVSFLNYSGTSEQGTVRWGQYNFTSFVLC